MNKLLDKIAGLVPGTAAHTARKKRSMERELRAQGYSRSQALRAASEYYARKP